MKFYDSLITWRKKRKKKIEFAFKFKFALKFKLNKHNHNWIRFEKQKKKLHGWTAGSNRQFCGSGIWNRNRTVFSGVSVRFGTAGAVPRLEPQPAVPMNTSSVNLDLHEEVVELEVELWYFTEAPNPQEHGHRNVPSSLKESRWVAAKRNSSTPRHKIEAKRFGLMIFSNVHPLSMIRDFRQTIF